MDNNEVNELNEAIIAEEEARGDVSEEVEVDPTHRCSVCGRIFDEELETDANGNRVCHECIVNLYSECEHCGELYLRDDMYGTNDGYVCQDCRDDYYSTCEHCGDLVCDDDMHYISIGDNGGDYYVCDGCLDYSEDYVYCEGCGRYYERQDAIWDDEEEAYFCNECYRNHHDDDNRVECYHNHHHDGTYDDKRALDEELSNMNYDMWEDGVMFMGIETECSATVGGNEVSFVDALNDVGIFVYERDSSINRNGLAGVEAISKPCTSDYLHSIKDKIQVAFDKARELGYRSDTDSTGIHIHVSRPKQGEVIDRILLVLETFKDEVIKVARRHSTNWSSFISDTMSSDKEKENITKSLYLISKKRKHGYGRYMALNLTNDKTIEFRLFRGTLNYKTWFAYLEFINNIMRECSNLDKPITDVKWEDLVRGEFISEYVRERDITCDKVITDDSAKYVAIENAKIRLVKKVEKLAIKHIRECMLKDMFRTNIPKGARNVNDVADMVYSTYNNYYSFNDIISSFRNLSVDYVASSGASVNDIINRISSIISTNMYMRDSMKLKSEDIAELNNIISKLIKLKHKEEGMM